METISSNESKLKSWGSRIYRWSVLLLTLTMIVLSVLKLRLTPENWTKPGCEFAGQTVELIPDPIACGILSSIILATWLVRDRNHAASDTIALATWLVGIPGINHVWSLTQRIIGMGIRTIIRKQLDESKEEGRREGTAKGRVEGRLDGRVELHGEYQEWLTRRTETGQFVWDEGDPPPKP